MKLVLEHRNALKEVRDSSLGFLREARNGTANEPQANIGAKVAGRIVQAVNADMRILMSAPKLAEIEKEHFAAA